MKRIALLFILIAYFLTVYSQEDIVLESVVNNINLQLSVFPHEKIYLHTDKAYYINGEKLFSGLSCWMPYPTTQPS
jgi:hypothetical protein